LDNKKKTHAQIDCALDMVVVVLAGIVGIYPGTVRTFMAATCFYG
jgi:hypothetical protein